jgi:two-component system chemotaxis response regulator CheY
MSYSILVVDDSATMRKLIIRYLKLSGFPIQTIYEASQGQEGLDILKQHPLDLVLVDINMPVMDGLEMVQQLRRNPETQKLPVLYISSESSATRIESLLEQGAGVVHKPFTPEELLENIQLILQASLGEEL